VGRGQLGARGNSVSTMDTMGGKKTKIEQEEEEEGDDVPDTPPEVMRILAAQNYEKKEAVRRDQKWYQFGRNVEYLEVLIRDVNRELHKFKGESHTLHRAQMKLREASISLQTLNSKISNELMDEIDYLAVLREWNRILQEVSSVQQVYKK
jgi:HPt (histidine-containing phosphotransfer) domain-containing protein